MVEQIIAQLLTKLNEKEEFEFVVENDQHEQKTQKFNLGKFVLNVKIDENNYQIKNCFHSVFINILVVNNTILELTIVKYCYNLGGFVNKTQDMSLEEMVNTISKILFKSGLDRNYNLVDKIKTTEEKDYFYSVEKTARYLDYLCCRIEAAKTIDDFCAVLDTGYHNNVLSETNYREFNDLKWIIRERNLWVNITRWVRPQLNFIANKISDKINKLNICKEVRRNGNEYFRCDEVDNGFTFHDVGELNEVFIQNYLVEETYEIFKAAEQM